MLAFQSAWRPRVPWMRQQLANLGPVGVGRCGARVAAIVAVLVMVTAGASAGGAGAHGEARASEVAVSPESYGGAGELEIPPRRPDIYVFGFLRDGSMMAPVRPVAEAYGATVHWVARVGTLVNGRLVETATVLSQAYSPARELATVLGCWLEWDQVARTVILSNGIQRVIVSVAAGSRVEEGVAPREASGAGGVSAGPGTGGPGAAGAAHAAPAGGAAGTMSAGTTAAAVPGSAGSAADATATTAAGTAASAGAGAVIGAGEGPGMTGGAGGGGIATTGPGPAAGAGTGSASATGTGSGGSGLSTPGGTGVSGTVPGVITVTPMTPAAPGTGTGGAGTPAAAGLPVDDPQSGAPVVTIASLPSAGSPGAPGFPGGPGGGAPVVVITPLPGPEPAAPPGEGPDGGGAAGAARRGPGGRPSAGKITLTFDDGPDAVYTKKILSVLDRYRVKATFFLIGNQVERHSAVVREMAAAGHELGNHGYSHSRLTTLSAEAVRREISRTQEAVKAAANVTPRWFRPPYGSYNDEIRQIAKEEGTTTVLWTLNPDDWRNPGQAAIVQRVTSGAKEGAIVLLHVREQTARALPALIEGLTSQGYELVPLSALFSGDDGRPALRTGGGQDGAAGAGSSPEPAGQPQGAPAAPASGTGMGAADAATGATGAE